MMLVMILSVMADEAASDNASALSEFVWLKEISALEVMANANNSVCVYDHVIIKADLKLNSTKIIRMVLDGSSFGKESRLYLARADINRLIVSWSQIRDIFSFDTAAYLSLIKNYKDLGQSSDANECYYEYRYLNQVGKPVGFSRFLDTVAWLTCGYGVRPHYALFCGMVIILIFSLIYWAGGVWKAFMTFMVISS